MGLALTTDNGDYRMAGSNGTVYPFGDARSLPNDSTGSDAPISGITGGNTSSINT